MRRLPAYALALGIAASSVARPAHADAGAQRNRAEMAIRAVEADATKGPDPSRFRYVPPTPAQRVAAGELLLRTGDYDRAVDTLSKVLELHRRGEVPESANADATFLIGEAYFQSGQYLSARRHYRDIFDHATQAPFSTYVGRSISRMVDVALRTRDLDSLDYVFARLASLPVTDASGSLAYARAKALYAHHSLTDAKNAVNAVPPGAEYTLQGQYLLGVIMTKEASLAAQAAAPPAGQAPAATATATPSAALPKYGPAIDQFRRVARMPATTPPQRHVVDLAWMAVGRLCYESEAYPEAAEAYSHVSRQSEEFSVMMHELSWVYVRVGDFQRAQRALEVLSIADPNNLDIADGSLLRADLLLRSGEFDKALTLYRSVRERFDPIRDQVDRFIATTADPASYYDRLTADPDIQTDDKLPPLALAWAREQAEDENVFVVIDDVNRSRDLIRQSRRLASRLNGVLAVPTRAKAFPEIRAALEHAISLSNKLAKARVGLGQGMDDVAGDAGGELASVRQERRALQRRLLGLPVTSAEFAQRDDAGASQWNKVSQSLQQLTVEADKLRAMVNALKRVLQQGESFGVTSNAATRDRFKAEIDANERDLQGYEQRIEQFREAIENGRVQSGFGDQRYIDDEQARHRYRDLLNREVELAAAGQDSGDATEYARSVRPVLQRADAVDARLESTRAELERNARAQADVLRSKIQDELASIEVRATALDQVDQEARIVVGEVAMKAFAGVRERLKGIVLRADVGIAQEAWEEREEEARRVRSLQRERAREEQMLNDELREVLEDAEEDQ
ncbi:MAG TPA: tetratricopeptide repeat protein [Polyangiaceae bacterium]|jgi:tetratricopeptide (TPR) repeat protein|nr:tetratricopeptide repeat protein [Polyangiaceae bacterium]